jgi:hypothetical protein
MKNAALEVGMMTNVVINSKKMRLLVCRTNEPEARGYAGIDVRSKIGKCVLMAMGNDDAMKLLGPEARAAYIQFGDTQIVR